LQATIDKRPEPFNEALRRPNAKLAMLRSRPRHRASRAQAAQLRPAEQANRTGYSIRKALCTPRFDR